MKWTTLVLVMLAAALQAGCVTGRRTLSLPVTAVDTPAAVKGHVYLAAVTDDRQFQNRPPDPSTPSIDGDVTSLSAQQKDRMIGRQRNGFGKAMGDISLADADSVSVRTRLLVTQALRAQGYQVTSDPAAPNNVSVSIQKFWAWMTPGFVALTFEAQIQCRISVTTPTGVNAVTVKGYGINHGQVAKDENWIEAFDPAFADFSTNLGNAVPMLGLRADGAGTPPPQSATHDVYSELKKLGELHQSGVLTDAEFEAEKRKLLAQ